MKDIRVLEYNDEELCVYIRWKNMLGVNVFDDYYWSGDQWNLAGMYERRIDKIRSGKISAAVAEYKIKRR